MYGKRPGRMRLVLGAFGMNIWRCGVPYAFRTPRMDLEHDECFPNVFGIRSVHSRSIRRVLKTFGKHTERVRKGNFSKSTCGKYSVYYESILKLYLKHSENERKAVGDTLGKTHLEGHSASLKNHTTFVYGKQTEAHSGQCDRYISRSNTENIFGHRNMYVHTCTISSLQVYETCVAAEFENIYVKYGISLKMQE